MKPGPILPEQEPPWTGRFPGGNVEEEGEESRRGEEEEEEEEEDEIFTAA
jgi:hypothetical protein